MNRVTPELTDMRHIKLCYSKDRYCGHPHQSGIFNPNPPKDTDGRREESGRGVRELQGK